MRLTGSWISYNIVTFFVWKLRGSIGMVVDIDAESVHSHHYSESLTESASSLSGARFFTEL